MGLIPRLMGLISTKRIRCNAYHSKVQCISPYSAMHITLRWYVTFCRDTNYRSSASTGLRLLFDSNAPTPSRMQSWHYMQANSQANRKEIVWCRNFRWFRPQSAKPSSPFCELVANWLKGGEWEKLILLTKRLNQATTCHGACRFPTSNEMLEKMASLTKCN